MRDAPDWRLGPAHPGSLELLTNHLPVVPVQVTEHVYIARTCPACRRRCIPPAQLDGVALGRQRLGVNVLSRIATLREEGRLPIRSVQWYLDTLHQLRLSVGAIVSAIHRTAQRAQPAVAAILDRIRGSPVVHADETGPTKPARARTAPMATCGLSAPPPNATSPVQARGGSAAGSGQRGGGRGAGRVVLRSAGQRLLRRLPPLRWPQATVLGPPVAGHPRPGGALPQGHLVPRQLYLPVLLPHSEMLPKTQHLGRISGNLVSYSATADESRPEQGA